MNKLNYISNLTSIPLPIFKTSNHSPNPPLKKHPQKNQPLVLHLEELLVLRNSVIEGNIDRGSDALSDSTELLWQLSDNSLAELISRRLLLLEVDEDNRADNQETVEPGLGSEDSLEGGLDARDEIGGGAGDLDGLIEGELDRGTGGLGALIDVVEEGGALDQDGDRLAESDQAAVELGDRGVELGGVAGDLGHGGEDGGAVSDDGGGQKGDGEDGETHVDGCGWGLRVEVKVVCLDGLACWFLTGGGGKRKGVMGGRRINYILSYYSIFAHGILPLFSPPAAADGVREPSSSGVEGGKVDHHRMWGGRNRIIAESGRSRV
ncbi:hypothetical protein VC83_00344 [Pseudogymnoascus destructans]|uniref:Uncharacterized protein n=1 Tax=Pseudogymnoascus destructans TaxID=655981 RepID=A0A177AQE3_9PEZI|nr:uncharacterized protein VC83_00344 [Pseudogymnoascus destructans]OAF63464.1 hypothetical protein VC83_00344 [Pseudogymnoascus destructans]